jgi:uncharacterized protein (UPF0333 family)
MYILFLFIILFVIIIIIFVINIVISFISKVISNFRALFCSKKSAAKHDTGHNASKTKIFDKNEGEYVEYEEIK